MPADAGRDADRPAGARDETDAELGEGDDGIRIGDDPPGEGRDLDAGTHAGAMEEGRATRAEQADEPARATGQAADVRRRRVRERPELGEVTTAGERRPGTAQLDRDGLVDDRHRQGVGQRGAQRFVDGVVAARAVERDDEAVAVALGADGLFVTDRRLWRWSRLQPCGELRARLEHRVHGGLGGEAELDPAVRELPQQDGQ